MRHSTTRDVANRHGNYFSRTTLDDTDDDWPMREGTHRGFHVEKHGDIEHHEPFGFTMRPREPFGKGALRRVAETLLGYFGGARSQAIGFLTGDRRFRPTGLEKGEGALYDDQAQMALLRRGFAALVSHDHEAPSDQSSGQGSNQGSQGGQSQEGGQAQQGGQGQQTKRYASLRHVEKKKIPFDVNGHGDQKVKEKLKHEGDSVNTEVRASSQMIHFFDGETMVGSYDKEKKTWHLNYNGDNTHSLRVDPNHVHIRVGGNSIWVDAGGCWSSVPIQQKNCDDK